MKTIYKLLFAGLLCFSTLTAMAAPENEDVTSGATTAVADQHQGHKCPHKNAEVRQSEKICEAPALNAFVAIDSVECAVHLVKKVDNKLDTVAVFKTDDIHKRHDLRNILRPVSVIDWGEYVVVLASAVNDSAYVAVFDGNLNLLGRRAFRSPMKKMTLKGDELTVTGTNPYGYDINILTLDAPEFKAFNEDEIPSIRYRVAKQSEKIKGSDPVGIGLTAVAVSVVFLALVCIALILQGTGKLMSGMDEKKKKGDANKKGGAAVQASAAAADKEGEIYAAIATAIHLYNDELHDEEDAVITIQKVEREWTPWNAKYYNMNQYFNNRR